VPPRDAPALDELDVVLEREQQILGRHLAGGEEVPGHPAARVRVRAIGYVVGGGSVALGIEAMIWGGLFRILRYQHATFSVNSICHMLGRQEYRSRDEARNNWVVALLVFGEG
jgi:hypothetical protein